jgi:hypothetical protein
VDFANKRSLSCRTKFLGAMGENTCRRAFFFNGVPTTENHADFATVQRKLDETIAKLRAVNDPNLRRELLRDLIRLGMRRHLIYHRDRWL